MQLLQVTTLLIEGRGEESPVKEDGCSGKKAPIEWHRKSKGNQSYKTWWFIRCIFRHYQVRLLQKFYIIGFLGFLNSTISNFFSYKIKLPVCKKKKLLSCIPFSFSVSIPQKFVCICIQNNILLFDASRYLWPVGSDFMCREKHSLIYVMCICSFSLSTRGWGRKLVSFNNGSMYILLYIYVILVKKFRLYNEIVCNS